MREAGAGPVYAKGSSLDAGEMVDEDEDDRVWLWLVKAGGATPMIEPMLATICVRTAGDIDSAYDPA